MGIVAWPRNSAADSTSSQVGFAPRGQFPFLSIHPFEPVLPGNWILSLRATLSKRQMLWSVVEAYITIPLTDPYAPM